MLTCLIRPDGLLSGRKRGSEILPRPIIVERNREIENRKTRWSVDSDPNTKVQSGGCGAIADGLTHIRHR